MEAESKFDMSEHVENWAPPPPVVLPQGGPQQQPSSVEKDDELEFESTLSTLVDHFNSLPPPAFGEPPELPELTSRLEGAHGETTSTRNHSIIWMVACSLVLGGLLAGGGIFALNYGVFGAVNPAAPTAVKPVVEIVAPEISLPAAKVRTPAATAPLEEKAEPQTEPLNEMKVKVASVVGAPISKPIIEEGEDVGKVVKAHQPKRVTIAKRQVKPVRKVRKKVKRSSASDTPKKIAAPAAASSGEWEDPYK